MVQFEEIIIADFFKERLSVCSIINIALCSSDLYNSLEKEYYNAMDDLTIYTWSRLYDMRVYIWGRAWNPELINWITGEFDDSLNEGQTTLVHLNELTCEDNDFFDFIAEIYGFNPKHKYITGKVSKEREICECPSREVKFYI